MKIETKIQFENGGVTISQTFDDDAVAALMTGRTKGDANPTPGRLRLGESAACDTGASASLLAKPAKSGPGGAEYPPTGPGGAEYPPTGPGGNGPLAGGLTVVFGSVIVPCDCGSYLFTSDDSGVKLASFAR